MAATEPPPAEDQNLIRLTRNEIRRMLAAAIAPVHDIEHFIHWSTGGDNTKPEPEPATTPGEQQTTDDHEVSLSY